MRPNTAVKRKSEDPSATVLRLAPGRSLAVMQSVSDRLAHAAKSPHDLTDNDLVQLYTILQSAVHAHSRDHNASAPMLDAFVEEIFNNWTCTGHLEPAPGAPKKLPYRDPDADEGYDNNGGADYSYEYYKLTPWELENAKSDHEGFEDAIHITYQLTIDFTTKKYHCTVKCMRHPKRRESRRVSLIEVDDSIMKKLNKGHVRFLGKHCDEHNTRRAIQYARRYIQQKSLSSNGCSGEYKFEQFSDIYDRIAEFDEDGMLNWKCPKKAPAFFGLKAAAI